MNNEQLNKFGSIILDSSIEVHKQLGPGLLESVYELSLFKELTSRKIDVLRQVPLPVLYKGEDLKAEFKIDLLIKNEIILELKAVEFILPVHKARF
ncbi:MAG TPA: GxxExxY protein [Ignavibacteriaceae bacterium]